MKPKRLLSVLFVVCSLIVGAAPRAVRIPEGETRLADIGIYQVAYQLYGSEPARMPMGWVGSFDPVSGITYSVREPYLGRTPIMIHCPWKAGTGSTWVDYPVELPRVTPVKLEYGIAVQPDASGQGKSDGVTFSCSVACDGTTHELMRRHYAGKEWVDCSFDLSAYAGKMVTLRLQVEPGPRKDPGFDFSVFGDARIIAGRVKSADDTKAEAVSRLMNSSAVRATRRASRLVLTNNPTSGVLPSNLVPFRSSLKQYGKSWRFEYSADDCRISYILTPVSASPDDVLVQVNDSEPFRPASGGGLRAVVTKNGKQEAAQLTGGRLVSATPDRNSVVLIWEYDLQGMPLRVNWRYEICGKALAVSSSSDATSISSFSLGNVAEVPLRRSIAVPYLKGQVEYLPDAGLFACRYLDWTVSHSSSCPQGFAVYEKTTSGTRNALLESGYIAVSPDIGEVLPNLPHPKSPYIAALAPRIMLDLWGHHKNSYAGDAEKLRELKDNGIDHLAIIQHVWQRYGYDEKLPDHLPANPQFGGDEGMKLFGQTANDCGYLWSLHENYIDLHPDAPSYDAADRVLNEDGSPSKAWFNAGSGVQSYGLKCTEALKYARLNAPEIHKRYRTTAAYLDVHTCVPPWHELDHDGGQPMAAMALSKVKHDTELFQFMRDAHRGPLFGEGNDQLYWAGRCDGVEAQVSGGEDHVPLLDFDLLKIHPQMVNHGMGYFERWYRGGYATHWGRDAGAPEQADKYRMQEIAYGHAGFVGTACTANTQWVAREHHLVHPVQSLYGPDAPVDISYEVEGQMVPASVALAVGDTWRQRITYSKGLRTWANWSPEPWIVEGHELPQWGLLALGPDTEVYTALRNGKFCDYAECPEYVFADSRTWFDMPWRNKSKKIEPRLRSFKSLGGNQAEITYEWIVNDELDADYTCFVHGVTEDGKGPEHIAFQQDHALARTTSSWHKGDVIIDGPHTLTLPAGTTEADIGIGLYKEGRVALQGQELSSGRIHVAHLRVERDASGTTIVTAAKPVAKKDAAGHEQPDFDARTNPADTRIDFGKVATDGAVKINREKDRLVIFPYPRDKRFAVEIDFKSLVPGADAAKIEVRALSAGDQKDVGPVPFKLENGSLCFDVGTPGAGRYMVSWDPTVALK